MIGSPDHASSTAVAALARDSPSSARGALLGATTGERVRLLLGDLSAAIGCDIAQLYRPDRRGHPRMVFSFGVDESVRSAAPHPTERSRRSGRGRGGFVGRALTHERATVEPLQPELDAALISAGQRAPLTQALAAPVRGPRDVGGALIAGFTTPPQDLALTLWTAEAYAAMAGVVLKNPSVLRGLLDAGRTDTLTGCITYEVIVAELAREVDRATRSGLALSCCFIDLDGFKRVNDEHGHLEGNEVLIHAARVLRAGVRSGDTIGRYGGDEVVAILPQASETDAWRLAERLRERIAAERISALEEPLTASVGVAQWTAGTSARELLERADRSLLDAKAMGGNIVIDSQSESPRA